MESAMKTQARKKANRGGSGSMRRRDVLRALGVGAGAAVAASSARVGSALAEAESNDEKRKARYQPNSADVQNYYRVNRYPQN
jgi:sugar (pentulose or hexulose) kinase